MAINDFIPTVWSAALYNELSKEYVAALNCNREFEGDIRSCGDTVKIGGVDPVTVFSYTKNTDFSSTLQTLSSNTRSLLIDQAKAFNFQIDDVDRAQQKPKIMTLAMNEAASALANAADSYIYGLYSGVGSSQTITKSSISSTGIVDALLEVREKLYGGNVGASSEVVLEVSPAVATKILKAKVTSATDNAASVEKGYIGSFLGFRIYVSNNIASASVTESGAAVTYYKCFARTRRAIAYAEQLSNIEAYRPEKRFADAVKGLHLYGAKLVYEKELVLLNISLAAEA